MHLQLGAMSVNAMVATSHAEHVTKVADITDHSHIRSAAINLGLALKSL